MTEMSILEKVMRGTGQSAKTLPAFASTLSLLLAVEYHLQKNGILVEGQS